MKTHSPRSSASNSSKIIACIVNPAGRDGESLKLWESAKPKLKEAGLQTEVHLTERVGHASEIAFSLNDA